MPRSSEIRHFASLLAGLTIAAVRATTPERLAEIHVAIEEAYVDVFALLSHDALGGHEALLADLMKQRPLHEVRQ